MSKLRHITTLQATVRLQGYPQANLLLHPGNCIFRQSKGNKASLAVRGLTLSPAIAPYGAVGL